MLIDFLYPPGRTKKQLAKYLDLSTRTVERYFELLEEVGFNLEKDEGKRFYIFQPFSKGIADRFSQQEAEFINDLITHVSLESSLGTIIQTKLFIRSQAAKNTESKFRRSVPKVIQDLSYTMKINRQVLIKNYYSASQGKLFKERKVSPITYSDNYKYLIAYEEDIDLFVNMRLDRIDEIKMLDEKVIRTPDDFKGTNIFHIAGNNEFHEIKINYLCLRQYIP